MGGNNITDVRSLSSSSSSGPMEIKGGLIVNDGLQFNGMLDLNGNAITNVLSIVPSAPVPPATMPSISISGDLDIGAHNLTLHSLTPANGTDSLMIWGDLNLNGNRLKNVTKLGIGVDNPEAALHVSTNDIQSPPPALLEHASGVFPADLHSIARLRAVFSSPTSPAPDGFGPGLAFEIRDETAGPFTIAQVGAAREGANRDGAIHFQTANASEGGQLTTRMILDKDGNLFVGDRIDGRGDLYIGTGKNADDDAIYFDGLGGGGGLEYLKWMEDPGEFVFSDNVRASSFDILSDRNLKEKFVEIDSIKVLEQVAAMPITTWNFKDDDPALRHIGPMAQDFHQAFGLGLDNRHISTTDADGVALAAIQALKRMLDEKERKIQELEVRLQKLEHSNVR